MRRPTRPRPTLEVLEDRFPLSAPGTLDSLLAGTGRLTSEFESVSAAHDLAVQANGKLVVVGQTQSAGSAGWDFAISRYHPDGSLDTTFDGDGKVVLAFDRGGSNADIANAVAIDPQGRILVAGSVEVAGVPRFGVLRLLPNGQLDPTFGSNGRVIALDTGGSLTMGATSLTVDARGRIVVAGTLMRQNADFCIVRLTDDGTRDATFGSGGRALVSFDLGGPKHDFAEAVTLDLSGRVVIVGSSAVSPGATTISIARLTTGGTLDSTFSGDGKQTVAFHLGGSAADTGSAVVVDNQNRVVLAGTAAAAVGSDFAVARLTVAGVPDSTFDSDGRQTVSFNRGNNTDTVSDLAIDSQGRFIIAGTSHDATTDYDFAAVRLTPTGALDSTFGGSGTTSVGTGRATLAFDGEEMRTDVGQAVAIDREGRVILVGSTHASDGTDFAIARLGAGNMIRLTDASGDDSPITVLRGGAVRVSYDFAVPPNGTIRTVIVEASRSGTTRTLQSSTTDLTWTGTRLVNLAEVPTLDPGTYWVQVRIVLSNGTSVRSPGTNLVVLTGALNNGTLAGETFVVTPTNGNAQVFRGLGGTDTLDLNVNASAIASVNGLSLADFVATRSVARQAIYRGSAYDFVRFTDGREVYFQGIERIQVIGATYEITVRPNDPQFANQWNLHTTDVPSAWRFSTGAGNVLLVSLDTGVLSPTERWVPKSFNAQGEPTDWVLTTSVGGIQDLNMARLLTDASDDDNTYYPNRYGHGHGSISVMVGTPNNGWGVTGINWNSKVQVADVYFDAYLHVAIREALTFARANGMRVVFQGGIQGEAWLTDGGTQAELEALIGNNADISLFAVAAGNGGQSTTATTGLSAGVARLQTTLGNVMSVGAATRTATTVNGLANATAVDRASYSNFGPDLTLLAPTDSPAMDKFGLFTFTGTSAANPNMAAIASLVWSVNPLLDGNQLRQVTVDTATDLGETGRDDLTGAGLVNADTAIRRASALFRDEEVARLVPDGSSQLRTLPPGANLPGGDAGTPNKGRTPVAAERGKERGRKSGKGEG